MKTVYSPKPCVECGIPFTPHSSVHKFCSAVCKGKHPYTTGVRTTESQYLKVSGNWYMYLQRLKCGKARKNLTTDDLVELLEKQNYRCALSGEPLTCTLGRGMINFTNASIDRIEPGSEYSKDNIRLVCRIANVMKWNMPDEELKLWCKRILEHA